MCRPNGCCTYLTQLLAAEQILLVVRAEADMVGNAVLLKCTHIKRPQPQHGQHDQQRLVVDVEEFIVVCLS